MSGLSPKSALCAQVIAMADGTMRSVAHQWTNIFPLRPQPEQMSGIGKGLELVEGFIHLGRLPVMRGKTAIRIQQDLLRGDVFERAVHELHDVAGLGTLREPHIHRADADASVPGITFQIAEAAGALVGEFQIEIVDVGPEQVFQNRRIMPVDVASALIDGMTTMKLTPRLDALEHPVDVRDSEAEFIIHLAEFAGVGEYRSEERRVGKECRS